MHAFFKICAKQSCFKYAGNARYVYSISFRGNRYITNKIKVVGYTVCTFITF